MDVDAVSTEGFRYLRVYCPLMTVYLFFAAIYGSDIPVAAHLGTL